MISMNPFAPGLPRPRVVGTGLIALDLITDETGQPPRVQAGGTCANVLAVLSYLGWRSLLVSRLNNDVASLYIQRDLERWGVQLDLARVSPFNDTPVIAQHNYFSPTGKPVHRFSWRRTGSEARHPDYKAVTISAARHIVDDVSGTQVFFFDRVSEGALVLARACAASGALIVFEPSGIGDLTLFHQALEVTHILKYSHDRLGRSIEKVLSVDPFLRVETMGYAGVRYRLAYDSPSDWREIPAYSVAEVRDASGAGDWCTVGLVHALGRVGASGLRQATTEQIHRALTFGQALAAWNCRFVGARGGMYGISKHVLAAQVNRIVEGEDVRVVESVSSPSLFIDEATIQSFLSNNAINEGV